MNNIRKSIPILNEKFSSQDYIGLYDIISIRVFLEFDESFKFVTIQQSLIVRKAINGINGWCTYFDIQNQEYYKYYDENDEEIESYYIEDKNKNYYAVVDFPQKAKIGELLQFKAVTKERADLTMLKQTMRKCKSLIISRLYGSSCDDFQITIKLPITYKLVECIPQMINDQNGKYHFKTNIKKLNPFNLAIKVKKKTKINKLLSKEAHPFVWVVVASFIGAIISLVFYLISRGQS